jgi:hypothetical protein
LQELFLLNDVLEPTYTTFQNVNCVYGFAVDIAIYGIFSPCDPAVKLMYCFHIVASDPLSRHLLSSSQNNAVALQDLKIKIIETTLTGMRSQDRLVKVFGSENCNH